MRTVTTGLLAAVGYRRASVMAYALQERGPGPDIEPVVTHQASEWVCKQESRRDVIPSRSRGVKLSRIAMWAHRHLCMTPNTRVVSAFGAAGHYSHALHRQADRIR